MASYRGWYTAIRPNTGMLKPLPVIVFFYPQDNIMYSHLISLYEKQILHTVSRE